MYVNHQTTTFEAISLHPASTPTSVPARPKPSPSCLHPIRPPSHGGASEGVHSNSPPSCPTSKSSTCLNIGGRCHVINTVCLLATVLTEPRGIPQAVARVNNCSKGPTSPQAMSSTQQVSWRRLAAEDAMVWINRNQKWMASHRWVARPPQ